MKKYVAVLMTESEDTAAGITDVLMFDTLEEAKEYIKADSPEVEGRYDFDETIKDYSDRPHEGKIVLEWQYYAWGLWSTWQVKEFEV